MAGSGVQELEIRRGISGEYYGGGSTLTPDPGYSGKPLLWEVRFNPSLQAVLTGPCISLGPSMQVVLMGHPRRVTVTRLVGSRKPYQWVPRPVTHPLCTRS